MDDFKTFLLMPLIAFCLTGCANASRQDVSTLSGAVIGGLVGSRFGHGQGQMASVAVGTLAGAYIGGAVGRNMDETDRLKTAKTLDTNPVGKPAYWTNPKSRTKYSVVPTKNIAVHNNHYCREYTTESYIAGRQKQKVYGTACRQPDGSWEVSK